MGYSATLIRLKDKGVSKDISQDKRIFFGYEKTGKACQCAPADIAGSTGHWSKTRMWR